MTLAVPTNFPATPSPSPTIIPLLLTSMLALASAASPPPPPPPPPTPPPLPPPPSPEEEGCSAGLVAFSICLPYVSAPPNNVSSSASPQCCDLISSAFENGYAFCLCYLIRQPLILGFPLNKTRILSLSSFCPPRNASFARSGSLESLCSGSPALPPLHSITTGPGIPKSSDSGPAKSPTPLMITPPESAEDSPTPPSSSVEPKRDDLSYATKQINSSSWTLLGIMLSLAPIFTCL